MKDAMRTCPTCHTSQNWTPGMRRCDQCGTRFIVTKDGIREHAPYGRDEYGNIRKAPRPADALPLDATAAQALGLLRKERQSVERKRLYSVIRADGSVCCAMCAHRTAVSDAIQGAISVDFGKFERETGKRYDSAAHAFHAVTESVSIAPFSVRGWICNGCAVAFDAREFRERDTAYAKRPALVRPTFYNTRWQRIEAEQTMLAIERTRRNLLDSGCPDWAAHDEAVRLASDGHTGRWTWLTCAAEYVESHNYARYRWPQRNHWALVQGTDWRDGREVAAKRFVPTSEILIPEPTKPTLYRPDDYDITPRFTGRWVVRRVTPRTVKARILAHGIGQTSVAALDSILGRPDASRRQRLPVVHVAGRTWLRLASGQTDAEKTPGTRHVARADWYLCQCGQTCQCAPVPVRFSGRPLPKRAIRLRLVA